MKIIKWGIVLLLIVGLSACGKQKEEDPEEEIIPALSTEVIKADIAHLRGLPKDLISIIDMTYTVTKIDDTRITVAGIQEIEMPTYDMTISFQINYYYFNKAWLNQSDAYTVESYQNIQVEPDFLKMNELAFEYVNSWPPTVIKAEDFRVLETDPDFQSGTVRTRYECDERWGPQFITYDFYMIGTFDPTLGWTYQNKLTDNPTTVLITYSGTKHFTWATLNTGEDFIQVGDEVEVTLTGAVKTVHPKEGAKSFTITEPLVGSLMFKGKTYSISPVLTTVESFSGNQGVELRWGEGPDEVFVFIYGLKNEENAQFPFFYVLSNDGSISEMSY